MCGLLEKKEKEKKEKFNAPLNRFIYLFLRK